MFGVTYTLSKSMDNSSNYRDIVPDTYNASNLWGPSEYDARHMVVVNYLYDLPIFRITTLAGKLPGGWELAAYPLPVSPLPARSICRRGIRDLVYGPGFQDWNISLSGLVRSLQLSLRYNF
jgi:hypothetical protein